MKHVNTSCRTMQDTIGLFRRSLDYSGNELHLYCFWPSCPESLYSVRQLSGSRQGERQAATSRDVDRD